ncbi:hypothetical protein NFJ02_10g02770, partial [Pycnococcus provasolii]
MMPSATPAAPASPRNAARNCDDGMLKPSFKEAKKLAES